jgi:hypothetical protein
MRADELMTDGGLDGQRLWLQIVQAIEECSEPSRTRVSGH